MTGLARTPERERYIRYLDAPYYACSPRFYASLLTFGWSAD